MSSSQLEYTLLRIAERHPHRRCRRADLPQGRLLGQLLRPDESVGLGCFRRIIELRRRVQGVERLHVAGATPHQLDAYRRTIGAKQVRLHHGPHDKEGNAREVRIK